LFCIFLNLVALACLFKLGNLPSSACSPSQDLVLLLLDLILLSLEVDIGFRSLLLDCFLSFLCLSFFGEFFAFEILSSLP